MTQNAQKINIPDPIYSRIQKYSSFQVWLGAMAVHVVIFLIVGLVTDYKYGNTPNFISWRSQGELINGFNVWVLVAAGAWLLYRWLPERMYKLAQELEEQGSIWKGNEDKLPENIKPLSEQLLNDYQSKGQLIIFLSTICGFLTLIYYEFSWLPSHNASIGSQVVFWFVTPFYSSLIALLYFEMACIAWNTIIRAFFIIRILDKYFRHPQAIKTLYPLHPDYCSGMGKVGELIVRFAQILVGIALVQVSITLYPILEGGKALVDVMLVVNGLYIFMLPIVLFVPIIRPHIAMRSYKTEQLLIYSQQIFKLSEEARLLIADNQVKSNEPLIDDESITSNQQLKDIQERIESLVKLHKFLEEEMHTSPMTLRSMRGFSVLASSPILVTLITIGIDFIRTIYQS